MTEGSCTHDDDHDDDDDDNDDADVVPLHSAIVAGGYSWACGV